MMCDFPVQQNLEREKLKVDNTLLKEKKEIFIIKILGEKKKNPKSHLQKGYHILIL